MSYDITYMWNIKKRDFKRNKYGDIMCYSWTSNLGRLMSEKMISELSSHKLNVTEAVHVAIWEKHTGKLRSAKSLRWEGAYCILETGQCAEI